MRPSRRIVLAAIGAVALAAIGVIALTVVLPRPFDEGPLKASSEYRVGAPLAPGESLSWSSALPINSTSDDATIRGVELMGVQGLEVVGMVATFGVEEADGSCLAAGTTHGFPPTYERPDGTTVQFPSRDIAGTVVPSAPSRTCSNHPSISVGVRRSSGSDRGEISGIRVRYGLAGLTYETVLPWRLTVEPR